MAIASALYVGCVERICDGTFKHYIIIRGGWFSAGGTDSARVICMYVDHETAGLGRCMTRACRG
eukprot:scaffold488762_cov17-Prasinocladus_malaysianus.AAC.1